MHIFVHNLCITLNFINLSTTHIKYIKMSKGIQEVIHKKLIYLNKFINKYIPVIVILTLLKAKYII